MDFLTGIPDETLAMAIYALGFMGPVILVFGFGRFWLAVLVVWVCISSCAQLDFSIGRNADLAAHRVYRSDSTSAGLVIFVGWMPALAYAGALLWVRALWLFVLERWKARGNALPSNGAK